MHHSLIQEAPLTLVKPRPLWRRMAWILAGGMACLAFGLRIWAVRWGLPYVDHPDEPALVNVTLRMLRSGDLNPHFFLYPSFYFYLLLGVFSLHYRWGLATKVYAPLDQMLVTTDLYTTIPSFFIWGRMLAIVIGSVTVLGLFALGKRVWSRSAGLCAAFFLATAPYHMRHSQYVTTDVASAWLVLLAYLAATFILYSGHWRAYLAAGFFAGLAASTKYNAAVVVLPIAVAHVLHWQRATLRQLPQLIAAAGTSIFAFVLGTPYAVLAWREFRDGLADQLVHYQAGTHGEYLGAWNLAAYADFFWNDGLRPAATVATIIGLAVLWRRQWSVVVMWLSFAVPYLLLFLAQPGHFMRNLLPLVVLCGLPIGVAAAAAISWLRRRFPRWYVVSGVALLLALYVPQTLTAVELTSFYGRANSKVLATEFINQLPRGQRIAVEMDSAAWTGDPIIQTVPFLTEYPLSWYQANNYRYLVANESWRDVNDQELYKALKAGAPVLEVFPGDAAGQPGPRIEVLDLGMRPETLALVRREALFGTDLQFLGYELQSGPLRSVISPLQGANERTVAASDALQINLTWRAHRQLPHDYAFFVHLVDAQQRTVAQRDTLLRQDEYQSSRWQPDELVVDRADLPLPPLEPGLYTIKIGVYRMDVGEALPLTQSEHQADGSGLVLTTIEVP